MEKIIQPGQQLSHGGHGSSLLPKLRRELKPGTRIVSHAFRMGSWEPEQTLTVDGRRIFFWTIPPR